jgi:hypothetical protein
MIRNTAATGVVDDIGVQSDRFVLTRPSILFMSAKGMYPTAGQPVMSETVVVILTSAASIPPHVGFPDGNSKRGTDET